MNPAPTLSVVLPCYRSGNLARESVEVLRRYLPQVASTWEIIVVDDGGGDLRDAEWSHDSRVRLLRFHDNRGKGAAVRTGLIAARGHVRIFTDVDLPFGVEEFPTIVELLSRRRFHLVIGDRTLPDSSYRMALSPGRRIASAVFSRFVGTLVTGGVFDTQCGLKALRGDVADLLCPRLQVDRFAFDVELLYVALKHRLAIKGIPVRLQRNETSSVRLLRDSFRSIWDVLRIKRWQLKGAYDVAALHDIVRDDYSAVRREAAMNQPSSPETATGA